jgi:aspartyl-tRNA(Asn)/glutamyl-tRNA(Gln) amidotransferase subunit B
MHARFKKMYKLDDYYCELLTEEKHTARYYDQALGIHDNPASIANWITTELFGRLNKENVSMENCPVSPENLASLVKLIDEDVISGKIAKTVFDEMFSAGVSPQSVVEATGLKQISNRDEIGGIINEIIEAHPEQAEQYRHGKLKMLGFFVGQVMKATEGKANPKVVNELLAEKLSTKP